MTKLRRGNVRRDCQCTRAQHRHGTRAAYERDRCGCFACRVAHAAATRAYRSGRGWTDGQLVPGIGTARRLRALAVIGHSAAKIAAQIGCSTEMISHHRRLTHSTIRADTAAAISAVYDQLWDQPDTSPHGRRCSTPARRYGWSPPMAWDDDTIDDPTTRPRCGNPRANPERRPCGTLAAVRRHYRRGEPLDEACRQANARREDAA